MFGNVELMPDTTRGSYSFYYKAKRVVTSNSKPSHHVLERNVIVCPSCITVAKYVITTTSPETKCEIANFLLRSKDTQGAEKNSAKQKKASRFPDY